MRWTLDTEVLPGFYGQLLAANQPDIAGSPFEYLDPNAGDACSLLFDLHYPAGHQCKHRPARNNRTTSPPHPLWIGRTD